MAPDSTFRYEVWMPAWNAETTIGAALASVLAQEQPPSRITVLDDGSTDATPGIARAMGVAVLEMPHSGLVVQNLAIERAEAEFLCLLDSDDIWHPQMSTLQAAAWRGAHRGVAVIATLAREFTSAPEMREVPADPSIGVLTPAELWHKNVIVKSAAFARVEAVRAVGGITDMDGAEDYDLWLRLTAAGHTTMIIEAPLCARRIRMESATTRAKDMLDGEIQALRRFHGSQYRSMRLPSMELQPRLSTAWWRTVARAARYGLPFSSVPPPAVYFQVGPLERLACSVFRSEAAFAATGEIWPKVAAARSCCRQHLRRGR